LFDGKRKKNKVRDTKPRCRTFRGKEKEFDRPRSGRKSSNHCHAWEKEKVTSGKRKNKKQMTAYIVRGEKRDTKVWSMGKGPTFERRTL